MALSNEKVVSAIDQLTVHARTSSRSAARARAFYELTKPNLSALVVVTGVLGFYLASSGLDSFDWSSLFHLILGMALTAGGACAANMAIEGHLDALMRRTRSRPIPSRRVTVREAYVFAALVFMVGFIELLVFCGPLPAALSLATLVIYTLIYTPAKRTGPISIAIGAIPGAIPPVMGWAAVRGELGAGSLALFSILFLWQFPHFLALAFMYREDYARAGFRFLPDGEHIARKTGASIFAGAILVVLASTTPTVLGLTGAIYLVGALAAGAAFGWTCLRAFLNLTPLTARTAFLASVTYLPALLALMVLDRAVS